jgi:energy-coupling factor transporter ATP-binding protein EcfA2
VKNYSSGMYVRLGFSVAINVDPDVLLVDEVLAVGDEAFQRKCDEKFADLRDAGKTIVVVSHSLSTVRTMCDEAAWLEHGVVKEIGVPGLLIEKYVENTHTERVAAEGGGSRWGTGQAQVERVELLDEHGAPVLRVRAGRPATLRFHYVTDGPIVRPVFGFGLHRIDGTHATGVNSRETVVPDRIDGRGHVDFEMDRLPLVQGSYDVTVAWSTTATCTPTTTAPRRCASTSAPAGRARPRACSPSTAAGASRAEGAQVQVTPRLVQVVLDSTDPRRAAEFWRELMGLVYRSGDEPPPPGEDDPKGRDWLCLRRPDGTPLLAFQKVDELAASTWPDDRVPQQLHLDLSVRDAASSTPCTRRCSSWVARCGWTVRTTRRSRCGSSSTPTATRSASSPVAEGRLGRRYGALHAVPGGPLPVRSPPYGSGRAADRTEPSSRRSGADRTEPSMRFRAAAAPTEPPCGRSGHPATRAPSSGSRAG